jgi:hypothetical protein
MSQALEQACNALNVFAGDQAGREAIAVRIIDLASTGVIDVAALRDRRLRRAQPGARVTMPRKRLIRPWTEEDDEKLRVLHRQGKQRAAIALRLGRSQHAVYARIKALLERRQPEGDAR